VVGIFSKTETKSSKFSEKKRLCSSCKNNEPSRKLVKNQSKRIMRWSDYVKQITENKFMGCLPQKK